MRVWLTHEHRREQCPAVRDRPLQQIEEHRDPAEDDHRPREPARPNKIEDPQENQCWPQCHQQKQQRRRILGGVEKRQHGHHTRRLDGPLVGIAVEIHRSQHDEPDRERNSVAQEPPAALRGLVLVYGAEGITRRHHADPWYERIQDDRRRAVVAEWGNEPALMKNYPEARSKSRNRRSRPAPANYTKHGEEVVADDDRDPDARKLAERHMDQTGKAAHRHAEYPEHLHGAETASVVEREKTSGRDDRA